jgi:F-type H+-transporting ATPase subunit b
MLFPFFYCPDALAAGELTPARRLWDNVLLVINFLILVFFFVKYAKKPLMEYLRGERHKIEEDLNALDSQFKSAKSAIDDETDKLKGIDQRIKEIQERVVEIGRREKEKIVEQARIAAEKMIQDAKVYSNYRVAMAKKELSDEMVDIAISMVEERLKRGISKEDNEKLTEQFILNLGTSKRHFE